MSSPLPLIGHPLSLLSGSKSPQSPQLHQKQQQQQQLEGEPSHESAEQELAMEQKRWDDSDPDWLSSLNKFLRCVKPLAHSTPKKGAEEQSDDEDDEDDDAEGEKVGLPLAQPPPPPSILKPAPGAGPHVELEMETIKEKTTHVKKRRSWDKTRDLSAWPLKIALNNTCKNCGKRDRHRYHLQLRTEERSNRQRSPSSESELSQMVERPRKLVGMRDSLRDIRSPTHKRSTNKERHAHRDEHPQKPRTRRMLKEEAVVRNKMEKIPKKKKRTSQRNESEDYEDEEEEDVTIPLSRAFYTCNVCGKKEPSCYRMYRHINRHHLRLPTHQCLICRRKFADFDRDAVHDHLRKVHKAEMGGGRVTAVELRRYVRVIEENKESVIRMAAEYLCPNEPAAKIAVRGGKKAKDGHQYNNNDDEDGDQRGVSKWPQANPSHKRYCKACKKLGFSHPSDCYRHINKYHLKIPTHKCRLCGMEFIDFRQDAVIRHLRLLHTFDLGTGATTTTLCKHIRVLEANRQKVVNKAAKYIGYYKNTRATAPSSSSRQRAYIEETSDEEE